MMYRLIIIIPTKSPSPMGRMRSSNENNKVKEKKTTKTPIPEGEIITRSPFAPAVFPLEIL